MPIDTIVKVSGTILPAATTDDIASVDMQADGEIMCIGGAITGAYTAVAVAEDLVQSPALVAELSFLSTNQIAANDARGSIAGLAVASAWFFQVNTAGGAGLPLSVMESLCVEGGITVQAGERIHLHGSSNLASLGAVATFMLYIKTRGGGRRAPKRR